MKLLILIALESPLLCWYLWHIGVLGWLIRNGYQAIKLLIPTTGVVLLGTGCSLLGTIITIVAIGQIVDGFIKIVATAVVLVVCGAIIDTKSRRKR